ncbi:MAG: thiamine pyrophosphate-dependent enzyme [Acidobacteriota bacterium]
MLKLADKRQSRAAIRGLDIVPDPIEADLPVESLDAPEPERRTETRPEVSAVAALVGILERAGIDEAFGVSGGAIALLFDAFAESRIALRHFRHESGAAFAATECHFASGRPTAVFATTGPGLLNALTGMSAARWDGAKVVLISGSTSSPQRGRWATQETSSYTMPQDALYGESTIFDYAIRLESTAELPQVARRLAQGFERPGRFVAHVCMPMAIQSARVDAPEARRLFRAACPTPTRDELDEIAALLAAEPFAIWAGFGATGAAEQVRRLAEVSGAKVFCSPRAKGVMPEGHPQYLGVTGLGGHDTVTDYMLRVRPRRVLVLGSRLGEATSFWNRDMVPAEGFVHVDIDPTVPGAAFPDVPTHAVHAEIRAFLDDLLTRFSARPVVARRGADEFEPCPQPVPLPIRGRTPVRPRVLMSAVQRRVIRATDALVIAECGNSFAWCNHYLRFDTPGRYRVSTLFGSMGHAATGVVGAAIGRGGKAVAITGDGSMLMNSELSTAVQYGVPAVWVVLNDAGYGMCRDGHAALGLSGDEIDIPRVDFAALARSVGAQGQRVTCEDELDAALDAAMAADGPVVLDVQIDASEPSPLLQRFESLIQQGGSKHVAGWQKDEP